MTAKRHTAVVANSPSSSHTTNIALQKPNVQYAALGVLLLWALIAQIVSSPFITYMQGISGKYLNLPFVTAEYTTRIVSVPPGYDNRLRVGDSVLALNGQAVEGAKQFDQVSTGLHAGDTVMVTVRRLVKGHAETRNIPAVVDRKPTQPVGRLFVLGLSGFIALSSVLLGFYIAFARSRDPLAWITMAMLVSFGHFAGSGAGLALSWWWRDIVLLYRGIFANSWPLWMVLFAVYFPIPFDFIRSRPWLNWLFAAPWIGLSALKIYGGLKREAHIRELGSFATLWAVAHVAALLAIVMYVCAFFLLLTAKKFALTTGEIRRRLNITIAGSLLSLLPFVAIVLSDVKILPGLPPGLVVICFLMTLLFPITIAYVSLVQRGAGSAAAGLSRSA